MKNEPTPPASPQAIPEDLIHSESLTSKERFNLLIQANQLYLAWIRTAITVLGLGVVLAKLALWIRITVDDPVYRSFLHVQELLGIALLAGATVLTVLATWVHLQNQKTIQIGRMPKMGIMPAYLLSILIGSAGMVLVVLFTFW